MARKKRAAEAAATENAATPIIDSVAEATQMPDTGFDPAELEKPPEGKPDGERPPFSPVSLQQTISLTADADGPKMRLFRNHRMQQVAITFDEKPGPEVIDQLRDAGFRWRGAERAWTKQLDPQAKWKTQMDAEKLFADLGNQIRESNGREPSSSVGG